MRTAAIKIRNFAVNTLIAIGIVYAFAALTITFALGLTFMFGN